MVEQTGKGEKFNKARQFMLAHPDLSRGMVNWRKMGWRTLYAALALRGARWDKVSKNWCLVAQASTIPQEVVKVSPPASNPSGETVLVRIIAPSSVIAQAVQNMLELAAATDLLLVRNSGVINSRRGNAKRVYLKFVIVRS